MHTTKVFLSYSLIKELLHGEWPPYGKHAHESHLIEIWRVYWRASHIESLASLIFFEGATPRV